jgi:hypothetical protein
MTNPSQSRRRSLVIRPLGSLGIDANVYVCVFINTILDDRIGYHSPGYSYCIYYVIDMKWNMMIV